MSNREETMIAISHDIEIIRGAWAGEIGDKYNPDDVTTDHLAAIAFLCDAAELLLEKLKDATTIEVVDSNGEVVATLTGDDYDVIMSAAIREVVDTVLRDVIEEHKGSNAKS